MSELRHGRPTCGRLMVGSGTDTYDPVCELPEGHLEDCRSSAAIDQHRLTLRCDQCGREGVKGFKWVGDSGGRRMVELFLICENESACRGRWSKGGTRCLTSTM